MISALWLLFATAGIAISIAQQIGIAEGDEGETLQLVMLALIFNALVEE